MPNQSEHFVINLDIKQVTREPVRPEGGGAAKVDRVISDVAHYVVRGDSLDEAIHKANAILDIETRTS